MMELTPSITVQLVSCTAACVGFAYWFNVKGIQVLYAGIGAFFTWLAYALLYEAGYGNFEATLVGSIFVAIYAQAMARINKAPATIFQTICVFPLVPGPNLYYMMYGIVMEEHDVAVSEAVTLVVTCLGIALGFIVIEILNKFLFRLVSKIQN
jgi:uncharacterized membrane protein YjjB (DUF3815 family)